jgi:hypothetical protein
LGGCPGNDAGKDVLKRLNGYASMGYMAIGEKLNDTLVDIIVDKERAKKGPKQKMFAGVRPGICYEMTVDIR